jgi:hypothetical protein
MAEKYYYKNTDITQMIVSGATTLSGYNITYNSTSNTYDNIDVNCGLSNAFNTTTKPNNIQAYSLSYETTSNTTVNTTFPSWANGFKIYIQSRKGADGPDGNNGNSHIGWCPGGFADGGGGSGGAGGTGGPGVISYSNVIYRNNLSGKPINVNLKATSSTVNIDTNMSITVNSGNNGTKGNDAGNGNGCTSQYKSQDGANGNRGANGNKGANGNNGAGGFVHANVPVTSNYTTSNSSIAKIFFFAD